MKNTSHLEISVYLNAIHGQLNKELTLKHIRIWGKALFISHRPSYKIIKLRRKISVDEVLTFVAGCIYFIDTWQ
jgi:hypothetical protein